MAEGLPLAAQVRRAPVLRRCNTTVTPRRTRCRGPAYPLQDLMMFLTQWEAVQGFIGFGTAYFIHLVSSLQCDLGVAGAIGEIGVAGGKSFAVLAFTRQSGEGLLACDLFKTGLEKDNVPDANLPLFLDVLETVRIPDADVTILKQSSLQLSDTNVVHIARRRFSNSDGEGGSSVVGEGGFRLFHVDGGHYLEAAFHDMNVAACLLVPGGVLLVDDLHNVGYPGVQEAFHRLMLADPPARKLEPFLFTGRLFLTTVGYAGAYRSAIRRAHPDAHRTEMYGVEVLTTHHLPIGLDDFHRMLLGSRPQAGPKSKAVRVEAERASQLYGALPARAQRT